MLINIRKGELFKMANRKRIIKRRKRRKKRLKRNFFLFIGLILISVLSYGTYLYVKADSALSKSYEDDGRDKSDLRDRSVDPSKDNVSILIMGVDVSEKRANNSNPRTDTLMVATLNKQDNSVKLLSIPRDSLVYIPLKDREDKINHAHAFGGAKATIDTIETLLEIPIDFHVTLDFEAFIDVVDALDGITIDVPFEFREQDSKDVKNAIHLLAGEQSLNGEEALALARTRNIDNDIERGKRQQEIIKAIVKKSVSVGSILKFDDIIDAVSDNMTTSMKFSEMKSFISYGLSGSNLQIDSYTLAGRDYRPNGIYYWQLDQEALEETKDMLKEHLSFHQ